MRVGIFGGSFNPIHKGHVGIVQQILQLHLVDEVWLMVSPLNPLKQKEQSDILPLEHRLQMAQLATESVSNIQVSDFEQHLPIPSYTITTLRALQAAYPTHEFVLIIGEDNWQRFPRWYESETLRRDFDILVYGRDTSGFIKAFHKDGRSAAWTDLPFFDISSTQIRQDLRTGSHMLARRWLTPSVLAYIQQHQLYQKD